MGGGDGLEGRNSVSINTIVQTSIAFLLAVSGFLMQSKLADVAYELKSIVSNLRSIEERSYKLSERTAINELRLDAVEKRVLSVTQDYALEVVPKKKTAP